MDELLPVLCVPVLLNPPELRRIRPFVANQDEVIISGQRYMPDFRENRNMTTREDWLDSLRLKQHTLTSLSSFFASCILHVRINMRCTKARSEELTENLFLFAYMFARFKAMW